MSAIVGWLVCQVVSGWLVPAAAGVITLAVLRAMTAFDAVPARDGLRAFLRGVLSSQRIPRPLEKTFRRALGHAIRNEIDDLTRVSRTLADEEVTACLNLCAFASAYVAIDVCGRQWPDEENRNGLAQAATDSDTAEAFGLTRQEAYDYLVRVALGSESLDQVFPQDGNEGRHDPVTLSFMITGQLLLAFHPEGIKWWDYLNIIENVYEVTANADLAVLPGLMLVSRKLGSPRVFGEIKPS